MRTGLVVTGVILLVLGVMVVIGGGAVLGVGEAAGGADCGSGFFRDEDCARETQAASAMFSSLGTAMMLGGSVLAVAGVGLLIAGVVSDPKPREAAPTAVAVQAPLARPCPACAASVALEARYCGACGAAISPVKPRLTP